MHTYRKAIRALTNAAWAFAVVVAAALGVLVGSWGAAMDGKDAELLLFGSILGAALGVTGGILGGRVVQYRRRRDEKTPDAVALLLTLESIEQHTRHEDVARVGSDQATALANLLTDLEDITVTPRLGAAVNRGIDGLKQAAHTLDELRRERDRGISPDNLQIAWRSTIVDVKAELASLLHALRPLARA